MKEKILLATLAFNNPKILDDCLSSWFANVPEEIHKCVLYQGYSFPEMGTVIAKYKNKLNIYLRRKNNWFVSGGWNIVLREAFIKNNYDRVILVGSDTETHKGFIESFLQGIDYYDFVESTHKFNCFMMSKKCFRVVGTFDENINAYTEDDDYRIRLNKSNINCLINHGDHDLFSHVGSATVKFDELLQFKNRKSFDLNKEYMFRKWQAVEKSTPKWKPHYDNPFNDDKWPLNKWVLEAEGRKKRLWHNIVEDYEDDRLVYLVNALNHPEKYKYTSET